jgi:pilus assembly protein CpaF
MKQENEIIITEKNPRKKAQLKKLQEQEQTMRKQAAGANEASRNFVKNKIGYILQQQKELVNKNTIDEIIKQYHIDYYKNIYTENKEENIKKHI